MLCPKNKYDRVFNIPLKSEKKRFGAPPDLCFGHDLYCEQLPCARVTAFSQTSLFLERFLRKPVSKTYRSKNYFVLSFK